MEDIKILIEKYFDTELTVEEERELCARLLSEELPEELLEDKKLILAMAAPIPTDEECNAVYSRVEAMIDALAEQEESVLAPKAEIKKMPPRKVFTVPRIVWSMVALFAVAVSLLFVYDYEKQTAGDANKIAMTGDDSGKITVDVQDNELIAVTMAENDTKIAVTDEKTNKVYGNRIAMADGMKNSDDRPQEKVEPEHKLNAGNIASTSAGEKPEPEVYGRRDMAMTGTEEYHVYVLSEPEIESKYNVDTFDNIGDAEAYLRELLSSISASIDENNENIKQTATSIRELRDNTINNIFSFEV